MLISKEVHSGTLHRVEIPLARGSGWIGKRLNLKSGARLLLRWLLDLTTVVGLFLALPVMKMFVTVGARRLPASREFLKRRGVFLIPDHYYWPLFNDEELTRSLSDRRDLPAIDWNIEGQLSLLKNLTCFREEILGLDLERRSESDLDFFLHNGSFESGDAEFLYAFIRNTKPRRIVEIGSGQSTKLAQVAVQRNVAEGSPDCEHVCIEPYEAPWLTDMPVRTIRERV